MSKKIQTVVVHGATGQQGGSVVRSLSAAGLTVRAAVRDKEAPKARELAALPGVQLVKIDLSDSHSLVAAYTGADAVFAVTVPGPDEVAQGKSMADASKQAGIALHVWSTLESVIDRTNGEITCKHFDDKEVVSAHIRELGISAVFLFLGAFLENAANFPVGKWSSLEEDGSIKLEYGGFALDVKIPFLRVTKDVGEAVKIIVAHPEDFVGQEVALGDIVQTIREQGEAISTATGHRVEVVQGPIPDIPQLKELANMYEFQNRFGMLKTKTIPNLILKKYGFKASPLEDFAHEVLVPHLKL